MRMKAGLNPLKMKARSFTIITKVRVLTCAQPLFLKGTTLRRYLARLSFTKPQSGIMKFHCP